MYLPLYGVDPICHGIDPICHGVDPICHGVYPICHGINVWHTCSYKRKRVMFVNNIFLSLQSMQSFNLPRNHLIYLISYLSFYIFVNTIISISEQYCNLCNIFLNARTSSCYNIVLLSFVFWYLPKWIYRS